MKLSIVSSYSLYIAILFFCWNGTLVDTSEKSKLPDVNFYGTIEDNKEGSFNFEYILIDRKYENIPVYAYTNIKSLRKRLLQKIDAKDSNGDKKDDPSQNIARLNLSEIKSIELLHPSQPTASIVEINGKDYIEIGVTLINGTKHNYIIETTRKITCKQIDKGTDNKQNIFIDRDLTMMQVKKIAIKGYKSPNDSDEKRTTRGSSQNISQEEKKESISKHTEYLLDQIEENVKNLSADNATAMEKMKNTITILLKSLREQLQKMLDLLQ